MMKNFLLFPTVGIMIAGSVIGCKPEQTKYLHATGLFFMPGHGHSTLLLQI